MKKISSLLLLVTAFLLFSSHDLFIKLDSYYLEPNQEAELNLLNGTFSESENTIARDRMVDATILGPGMEEHPPDSRWRERGAETVLSFRTEKAGTYVAGVSTRPRRIELSAENFNEYLEHDGVLDILEQRIERGKATDAATEKYAKHVKAIFQVGDKYSPEWERPLYYPIEFVPVANPYELEIGDLLEVRLLLDGRPLADQLVYASYEGYLPGKEEDDREAFRVRTDKMGVAAIPLTRKGKWYVRTIYMKESEAPGIDYESQWATLTIEVD